MDWLTFISTVVRSLAWPATVITLLVIVRKTLPELVRSLRKFKVKSIEIEFAERAKELAKDVGRLVPAAARRRGVTIVPGTGQLALGGETTTFARSENSKSASRRGQILEGWLLVEEITRSQHDAYCLRRFWRGPGVASIRTPTAARPLEEGLIDRWIAATLLHAQP